jgi:hypothetical protein
MHLLIIVYSTHTETIKTATPKLELEKAFKSGNVLTVIQDNKIIYTQPRHIS